MHSYIAIAGFVGALCTHRVSYMKSVCDQIVNSSESASVSHYLGRATIRSWKRDIYGRGIKYCAVKHSRTVASVAVWIRISDVIAPGRELTPRLLIASQYFASVLSHAFLVRNINSRKSTHSLIQTLSRKTLLSRVYNSNVL